MLQQTLKRSLRTSCSVCQCRCGTRFTSNTTVNAIVNANVHNNHHDASSTDTRARHYATRAKAPSTRERNWQAKNAKPRQILPTQQYIRDTLNHMHKNGHLDIHPDDALAFLHGFKSLVGSAKGNVTADPKKTSALLAGADINERDVMLLPRILLGADDPDSTYLAKKLVLTLSRVGYIEASIRIMAEAVLNSKKRPTFLNSRDLIYARQHLSAVANEKLNYRAMVCEGKVARALGDEERAIHMWTEAMTAAVAAAEELEEEERTSGVKNRVERDPLELSTPWIELMLIHWERSKLKGKDEMAQCEWAMNIGCEQDDPTSHYYASTFVKRLDSGGGHIGTSEWLYHVTKAASSGHPKAAYELGVFYAESGWKYIEDEPPDHVKPTPFDSYPGKQTSRFNSFLQLFGWQARQELKPQESVFHNAMFPSTAIERYLLAYHWLNVATGYCYAPAYLFHARMLLQDSLWAGANAPQAALELSPDRYNYASKEDYEAERPLPDKDTSTEEDPPNPTRSEEAAKSFIREVFYAHEANSYGSQLRQLYAKSRRSGQFRDEDSILDEGQFQNFGAHIQKFFRFPEVREMYEDQVESLYAQAKELCDQHNFDIYDDKNGLIYKAGTGKARPAGKVVNNLL